MWSPVVQEDVLGRPGEDAMVLVRVRGDGWLGTVITTEVITKGQFSIHFININNSIAKWTPLGNQPVWHVS